MSSLGSCASELFLGQEKLTFGIWSGGGWRRALASRTVLEELEGSSGEALSHSAVGRISWNNGDIGCVLNADDKPPVRYEVTTNYCVVVQNKFVAVKMDLSSFVYYGIILGLMTVCDCYIETVIGVAGEQVTLPCRYSVKSHGVTDTCWGRGAVPFTKCSNTISSTEGDKVTYRQSHRYQLLRGVSRGDVSLTILNTTKDDTGIYGCRVEIPGLFNDLKYNFLLVIGNAPAVVTGLPVFITTAQHTGRAYWVSHTGSTELDASIGAQEWNKTFIENTIRIGAIIVISVLIILIFIGLRCSKEKPQGSTDGYYRASAF
ncbi:hypothetical protein GN956_G15419 [Arapaima gigas]